MSTKKFEYRVLNKSAGEKSVRGLLDQLNALGSEGWDFTGFQPSSESFLMKREIDELRARSMAHMEKAAKQMEESQRISELAEKSLGSLGSGLAPFMMGPASQLGIETPPIEDTVCVACDKLMKAEDVANTQKTMIVLAVNEQGEPQPTFAHAECVDALRKLTSPPVIKKKLVNKDMN